MSRTGRRLLGVLALAVTVGLATGLAPFASASPDGLERVAQRQAFAGEGRLHTIQKASPAPGYAFPGVASPRLATALAGFTGTLLVFGLGTGLALAARRRAPAGS